MSKTDKKHIRIISNLEQMVNPKTRPRHIVDIGDVTMYKIPTGKTTYVYGYTEVNTKMAYIGVKSIDTDKKAIEKYNTSSKSVEFQKALANGQWKHEILSWGSFKECLHYENNELEKVNARVNPMYYNKWNGQKGIKPQNRELRNKIVKDINILRNLMFEDVDDWKANPNKYNERLKELTVDCLSEKTSWEELYENKGRIQVREEQLNDGNVYEIKDRIKHNRDGLQWPVYFGDIVWQGKHSDDMQISGNHTEYSHWDLGAPYMYRMAYYIQIPKEVHGKLTQTDIYEIGSALNTKVAIGKPFSKEDAFKICKEHYTVGSTWYDADVDDEWRQRGLSSKNIQNVIDTMNEWIDEQTQSGKGLVKINYSTPEGKAILKEEKDKLISANPRRLVMDMAGTSPNSDKVHQKLAEENAKIADSFPIGEFYTSVALLLHHSSDSTRTQSKTFLDRMNFIDNMDEGHAKDAMKELVNGVKVTVHHLPRYMSDTVYKTYSN